MPSWNLDECIHFIFLLIHSFNRYPAWLFCQALLFALRYGREQTDKDNKNTASENDIPKTGVTEDITVVGFIIICVGSAIYAYRKIKKYNV